MMTSSFAPTQERLQLTCTMQVPDEWVGPFEIPPCAALGSESGWKGGDDFWCMSWRGVSGAQMRKVEDSHK